MSRNVLNRNMITWCFVKRSCDTLYILHSQSTVKKKVFGVPCSGKKKGFEIRKSMLLCAHFLSVLFTGLLEGYGRAHSYVTEHMHSEIFL